MIRGQRRQRRRPAFSPAFDGLECRVALSGAGAGAIRPDAQTQDEFLDQSGRVGKNHAAAYGFIVHSPSTITVVVSSLPAADTVRLESASTFATLSRQSAGANFSVVLQPGTYLVQVKGRKKARFQIRLLSAAVASSTPAPTSGQGGGSPSGGGSTGGGASGGGTGSTPSLPGTYQGEAVTQITQINPLNGQETASNTYEQPTTMIIGPRATDGEGNYENNPFNLLIAPTDDNGSLRGGDLNLSSASVLSTDLGPLLLRYWTLEVTSGGFSGVLSNNQTAEGAALNTVVGLAYLVAGDPQFGDDLNMYVFQDASSGAELMTTLTATFTSANTIDVKIEGVGIAGGSEAVIDINFIASRVS